MGLMPAMAGPQPGSLYVPASPILGEDAAQRTVAIRQLFVWPFTWLCWVEQRGLDISMSS